jgi:hypothetical protein
LLTCLWLAPGCSTGNNSSGSLGDATFELPPARHVVDDIPDGFFAPRDTAEVPPAQTGTPPLGGDGGSGTPNDVRTNDGGVVDTRRDLPRETAGSCDLLRQSCPAGDGCYPGVDGNGVCARAGGRGETVDCTSHDECLPGYICAQGTAGGSLMCLRVCDPRAATTCPGGRGCRVHPEVSVGSCTP